jgi:hypothetical protein
MRVTIDATGNAVANMTVVTELGTSKQQEFSCDPRSAVVCAYEQSKGNFNTWTYDFNQAVVTQSGQHVYCGNFAAKMA